MKRTTKPQPEATELPPLVKAVDTRYTEWDSKDKVVKTLTFYRTVSFGWCLATLAINARRGRTYAVRCSDGAGCRIGGGPHVTKTVQVYVRQSRAAALQKYLDQHEQGAVNANTIRDRISSRRAEGSLRRARGEYSWRWSI